MYYVTLMYYVILVSIKEEENFWLENLNCVENAEGPSVLKAAALGFY